MTHNMTGTIAPDGSISGTWNDNYHGVTRTGTFTATGAAVVDYSGKGTALYTDENGSWYFMSVKSVKIERKHRLVRGQIIASNLGYETSSTSYLFVKITDVAEPGIGKDITSGDLITEAAALEAVSLKASPSTEAFINVGNIAVH